MNNQTVTLQDNNVNLTTTISLADYIKQQQDNVTRLTLQISKLHIELQNTLEKLSTLVQTNDSTNSPQ